MINIRSIKVINDEGRRPMGASERNDKFHSLPTFFFRYFYLQKFDFLCIDNHVELAIHKNL